MLLHLQKRGHWLTPVVAMKNSGWVEMWTPKCFWLEHAPRAWRGENPMARAGESCPRRSWVLPIALAAEVRAEPTESRSLASPTWWLHLSTWNYSVLPVGPLDRCLLLLQDKSCYPLPALQYLLAGARKRVVPAFLSPCSAEEPSRACSQGCLLPSAKSWHPCGLHWCLATQLWTAEQKLTSPYVRSGLLPCDGQGRTLELFQIHSPVCRELNGTLLWYKLVPTHGTKWFLFTSCDWKN